VQEAKRDFGIRQAAFSGEKIGDPLAGQTKVSGQTGAGSAGCLDHGLAEQAHHDIPHRAVSARMPGCAGANAVPPLPALMLFVGCMGCICEKVPEFSQQPKMR